MAIFASSIMNGAEHGKRANMGSRTGCCVCRKPADAALVKLDGATGAIIWGRNWKVEYNTGESTAGHSQCYNGVLNSGGITAAYYDPFADQIWLAAVDTVKFVKVVVIDPSGNEKFSLVNKIFNSGGVNRLNTERNINQVFMPLGYGSMGIFAGAVVTGSLPAFYTYDSTGTFLSSTAFTGSGNPLVSQSVITNVGWAIQTPTANCQGFNSSGVLLWTAGAFGGPAAFVNLEGYSTVNNRLVCFNGAYINPSSGVATGAVVTGGAGLGGSSRNAIYAGPDCVALCSFSSPAFVDFHELSTGFTIHLPFYPPIFSGSAPIFYMDGTYCYIYNEQVISGVNQLIVTQYDYTGSQVWRTRIDDVFPAFGVAGQHSMTVDNDGNIYVC